MKIRIAKGKPNGSLVAPPSKSYAHRYLIGAALSCGRVSNLSFSADEKASISCLDSLGFISEISDNSIKYSGFERKNDVPHLNCNESGSTLRFFIPIALALYDEFVIEGTSKLISRGIEAYEDCLSNVATFIKNETSITVSGKLMPGDYVIDASKSSQYVSGMLIALSMLDGESTLTIKDELNSKPYVDITVEVLSRFGISIKESSMKYLIPDGEGFKAKDIVNEGDYSNSAFLEAFNYQGGLINLTGLNPNSLQGDKVYRSHFETLSKGYAEIDVENCIDLSPILFSFASLKHGGRFINTRRLAIKESNRALAMKEELEKAGVKIIVRENEVVIEPSVAIPSSLEFNSHNDHRIAMALSLYSSTTDIIIDGAESIDKSYPEYWNNLKELGMEVNYVVA
ncbi:MAG: hypothetical protein MJ238_07110 [Bacilli bacterium]|nr:hypothetical protein [Bacilli bacterium]